MLSLLLMTSLAAVPGRQLPNAEVVLHAPSVRTAGGVSSLLDRAARTAPSISTSQRLVFPLLEQDALQAARLTALGGEPGAPLTASVQGSRAMTCLSLADAKAFDAAMGARVHALGEARKSALPGVTGARTTSGSTVSGWVRKKSQACTWSASAQDADATERLAAKALTGASGKTAKPKAGVAFSTSGVEGHADGDADRLTVRGRTRVRGLPPLGRAGVARYGGTPVGGTAQGVLRVPKASASKLLEPLLRRLGSVCSGCDAATLRAELSKLGPLLTGEAVVRAGTFRPTDLGLRSQLGRFRALPFAIALEITQPASVDALLTRLGARASATAIPGGVRLKLAQDAALVLTRRGDSLLVGSSEPLLEALAGALPQKGRAIAHAAEITLVPQELTAAMARLPLLEVITSPELAPLLVIERELGGLLSRSRALTVGFDRAGGPRGTVAYDAAWELAPTVGTPGAP